MIDGLTSLPLFDELAAKVQDFRQRGGSSVFALAFDFDGLIWTNDYYGFAEADSTLIKLAGFLREMVKSLGGAVFRIDGDGFLVLIPDCPHGDAVALAAKAVRDFQNPGVPYQRRDEPDAIASINAVVFAVGKGLPVERKQLTEFVAESIWSERKKEPRRHGFVVDLSQKALSW